MTEGREDDEFTLRRVQSCDVGKRRIHAQELRIRVKTKQNKKGGKSHRVLNNFTVLCWDALIASNAA